VRRAGRRRDDGAGNANTTPPSPTKRRWGPRSIWPRARPCAILAVPRRDARQRRHRRARRARRRLKLYMDRVPARCWWIALRISMRTWRPGTGSRCGRHAENEEAVRYFAARDQRRPPRALRSRPLARSGWRRRSSAPSTSAIFRPCRKSRWSRTPSYTAAGNVRSDAASPVPRVRDRAALGARE